MRRFLLLFFFSPTWYFYHKKVDLWHTSSEMLSFFHRSDCCWKYEFDTDVIIENYYHHDGEQLGFYKKIHIKTLSKKKDVLVIFISQETKNSNLFDKNCTQENVKCHIEHEGSWLRWIVIEQVNCKWHDFLLIIPERICAGTLSKSLQKNRHGTFYPFQKLLFRYTYLLLIISYINIYIYIYIYM